MGLLYMHILEGPPFCAHCPDYTFLFCLPVLLCCHPALFPEAAGGSLACMADRVGKQEIHQ